MKKLFGAMWLALPAVLLAEQLTFTGTTDKNPLLYQVGETMTFTVTLVDKDAKNAPVKGRRLLWNRQGDDGKSEKGEGTSDVPLVVKTSIDRPGFVRLTVNVLDAQGKPLKGKTEKFDGGAGAAVNDIATTPPPADFNAFWDAALAKQAAIPFKHTLTPVPCKDKSVEMYSFTVNMRPDNLDVVPGEGAATGLVAWPKGAKAKSLPMQVHVTGYGFGATSISPAEAKKNLVLTITRHGEKPREDEAYYKNLQTNLLKGFCWRNAQVKGGTDEYKMVMRDVRALAWAKKLPVWNGRDIKVQGGSMGGFQSIALAALDRDVTACTPFIPWMTDLAGKTNFKRMGGWLPGWTEALAYTDSANLATRVTCPVNMSIGLGDYVCPPSGEMILFRNFKGPKSITARQNMGHGAIYGVETKEYTFKEVIRWCAK